jgi:hypothetical protein
LSRNEAVHEWWLEHFDGLLNTDVPDQLEDVDKIRNLEHIEPPEQQLTVAEMEDVIKKRKNNKSPAMDFTQVETIKSTMDCPILPAVQHSTC